MQVFVHITGIVRCQSYDFQNDMPPALGCFENGKHIGQSCQSALKFRRVF